MQFSINAEHPALPGHFPGKPIVPGVVILDHVVAAVASAFPAYQVSGIRKLKFLRTLLPGEKISVQCGAIQNGRVRFKCLQGDECITEGNLVLAT